MKIVYYSETGNVESFAKKIDLEAIEIDSGEEIIEEKYILIIPTTGIGEIPDYVLDFLESDTNIENCVCACVSGSMEWEETYCGAADQLEEDFNIKVILRFENEGTMEDVKKVRQYIDENN